MIKNCMMNWEIKFKTKNMFESIEKLIEGVYRVLPYSNQIKNLEIDPESVSASRCIRFEWRSGKYCITMDGYVNSIDGSAASSSDSSILMAHVLKLNFN